MNRFVYLTPSVLLAAWTTVWAAPDSSHPGLYDVAPYLALILAFLGMGVGVLAGTKRGLNLVVAALGGFVLGPLAFVLFFVPRRLSLKSLLTCPHCGSRVDPTDVRCGNCHRRLGSEDGAAGLTVQEVMPKAKPAEAKGLSSEFAQYSEMLRRTLPGALSRGQNIDYSNKFGKAEAARCVNPDCGRLLPPSHRQCPHCGTHQG